MKSPFEIQNELGQWLGLSAIKRIQADALLHALHVIRTTQPKQADEALTQLVFELLGKEFKIPRPTEQEMREEKEERDFKGDIPMEQEFESQSPKPPKDSIASLIDEILDEDHT